MYNIRNIKEIDISKQARALAWLRLSDYTLIVTCGLCAIFMLINLVHNVLTYNATDLVLRFVILSIFCYAIFAGWRQVGVIDPAVWHSSYKCVFPMLVCICVFFVSKDLIENGLSSGSLENSLTEERIAGFVILGWIVSVIVLGWISLMILRTKITEIGVSVSQILQLLAQKAGAAAVQTTNLKRINKPLGLVFGITGFLILLSASLFEYNLKDSSSNAIGPALLMCCYLLLKARQYLQIDIDSLLAVDHRPPILFLRSFDDDEKVSFRKSRKTILDFSLESRLANHFFRFGPFVAIGSPKETVPQIGASRVLLSDDEWQIRVLNWMRDAKLIVMYSGKTHWVNWELQQVICNNYSTKLLLIVPEIKARRKYNRNKEITARVEQIRRAFKNTAWEEELSEIKDILGLRAMIFHPDGSVIMISSRSRKRDAYHLAALIAHQYMHDPDSVSGPDTDSEHSQQEPLLGLAVGIPVSIAIAVISAVLLFTQSNDSQLVFKRGTLYYSSEVTKDIASSVGEYLVHTQFFSDKQDRTVQLYKEDGRYRLLFVIKSGYDPQDLNMTIQCGVLGSQIAQNVLGGKPIEVGLTDDHLNLIRILPVSSVMFFGKSHLGYTEPVAASEANAICELLIQNGFYKDDKRISLHVGLEKGIYQLRFMIQSDEITPEIKAATLELSHHIATVVLGGKPVVMHLCDNNLQTLQSEQLLSREKIESE